MSFLSVKAMEQKQVVTGMVQGTLEATFFGGFKLFSSSLPSCPQAQAIPEGELLRKGRLE